jgi:hypothetical protein
VSLIGVIAIASLGLLGLILLRRFVMPNGASGGCTSCTMVPDHVSRHAAHGGAFQTSLRLGRTGSATQCDQSE